MNIIQPELAHSRECMHVCIHILSCIYTCIHTDSCTHEEMHKLRHTYTHTLAHTCTYIQMSMHPMHNPRNDTALDISRMPTGAL